MCHIFVVISEIFCRKCLVTLMNSFWKWGLSYALGGKSAECVCMKLPWHQPKICRVQVTATLLFNHVSVIHFSLRGCQIIFFINCIFDVHVFIFHESWFYGYDPGTKQQSSQWKSRPPAVQGSWGSWSQTSRACLFSWTVRHFFRRSFLLSASLWIISSA